MIMQKVGFTRVWVLMVHTDTIRLHKKTGKLWMCVDFQALNSNTQLDISSFTLYIRLT